ncbi:MAG: hypothetical protein HUU56_08370 [Bdellovibrionaceae bacterium]|nr:hypothetical protein [Pseudobdellovibrionaceae bacterium]
MKNLTIILAAVFLLTSGCLKIQKKKTNQNLTQETISQTSGTLQSIALKPVPLKLCHRPTHYQGLKRCVRNGKWVKMNLWAKDVDNDRTDVFTEPGMSLLKQNFYNDTFQVLQNSHILIDYPDQYRISAGYGEEVSFRFAVPYREALPLSFNYWGRDEHFSSQLLPWQIPVDNERKVKIQHWNDGSSFKKHARLKLSLEGDYKEINYRLKCEPFEQEDGYDYTQVKTKEGIPNFLIPETLIWRKLTENCESLSAQIKEEKNLFLPFIEIKKSDFFTEHGFKNHNKDSKKIYIQGKSQFEFYSGNLDLLNPISFCRLKMSPKNLTCTNERNEVIQKMEAIYEKDLEDKSFFPEN